MAEEPAVYAVKRRVYSEAVASAVCAELEQGHTLNRACEVAGVSARAWQEWTAVDEVLARRSAYARERGCDMLIDEAQRRLDACDPASVPVVREQVQHMRWRASKLAPRRYGDRVAAELSGPGGGPIEVSGARARVLAKLGITDEPQA